MSSTVLELQAARIQAYLGRSSSLRHIRGASAMVTESFRAARSSIDAASLGIVGVESAPGAPDVDGKLSVLIPGNVDPIVVAEALAAQVRSVAPALQVDATWAAAETWQELPPEVERQRRSFPHLGVGLPLARRCDHCAVDSASRTIRLHQEDHRVCDDCARREDARSGGAALSDIVEGDIPADFGELAEAWPTPDGVLSNHLATVHADGNRLGATFRATSTAGADRVKLAEGLRLATRDAVGEAFRAVMTKAVELGASADRALVIPHVMGGDDVLVSLPAAAGALFVSEYLSAFETRATSAASEAGVRNARITASAGLCIAHAKHPFRATAEVADHLAGDAKKTYNGEISSFAWADLTHESADTVDRVPWALDDLTSRWDDLNRLAKLGKSRRSQLAGVLRDEGAPGVRRDAQRIGDIDAVEAFLEDGGVGLDVALQLTRRWT